MGQQAMQTLHDDAHPEPPAQRKMAPWGYLPEALAAWQRSSNIDPAIQPPAGSEISADYYRYLHYQYGAVCAEREAKRYPASPG